MPESSTKTEETKKGDAAEAAESKEEPKVPVAALAEQRAKTRAANSEVEKLSKELEKAQSQLQDGSKVDPAAMSQLVAQMLVETRQQVEKEFEPMRHELAQLGKFKLAAQLGLSEKQVDKVIEIQSKFDGKATTEQALLLAKAEAPDLFTPQQPAWNKALHGGLPVTGPSPARLDTGQRDYTAEMHKAAAVEKPDLALVRQLAAKAFEQRVASLRSRR